MSVWTLHMQLFFHKNHMLMIFTEEGEELILGFFHMMLCRVPFVDLRFGKWKRSNTGNYRADIFIVGLRKQIPIRGMVIFQNSIHGNRSFYLCFDTLAGYSIEGVTAYLCKLGFFGLECGIGVLILIDPVVQCFLL